MQRVASSHPCMCDVPVCQAKVVVVGGGESFFRKNFVFDGYKGVSTKLAFLLSGEREICTMWVAAALRLVLLTHRHPREEEPG